MLGMKSLGGSGEIVVNGAVTHEEGLRYAMSLRGHYHQRDGFFGGARTEPESRARISAAGEGKDGVVARTGPNVSRGRAIRAFQDHNEVRRKGRTRQHHYPPQEKLPA